MDSDSLAYMAGQYAGALVLTGLVTRGAMAFFRKRESRSPVPILAFLTAAVFVLGFRCLGALLAAPPDAGQLEASVGRAVVMFIVIDLPCLLVWLGFDLYRERRRGRPAR